MSRHSESLKRSVVELYLGGEESYASTGAAYDVDAATVRKWVALYRAHGDAGLSRKSSRYDAEFKLSVLARMWNDGLSHRQAAALFNIRNAGCLSDWEQRHKRGGLEALIPRPRGRRRTMPKPPAPEPSGLPDAHNDEAKGREALLAELNYLRMENAYLKKLEALTSTRAQRAQAVQALRPFHPLEGLLKVAGLSRSTFYYRQKVATCVDRHAALKEKIKAIFDSHKGRYGYRRVVAALRGLGRVVNHKTIQRLMAEMGLKSLVRPKKYRSYKGDVGRAAPDLVQRQFGADSANCKWVTDVTEFNLAGDKLYLSPVMDLYNGEIIAFETSRRPLFKLVDNMLTKALKRLDENQRPILHSDQGWQYRMPDYQLRLQARGIAQSMSRKGNCLDNAPMESFFAILKSELFHPGPFETIQSLKDGIEDYIHYYNHHRIKLKLKGLSPVQYRTQPLNLPVP
ncbi:IS3 family transposase [Mesorhizobium sanjuanii]|uniref:IS3 family transposase n=1 Tax=Mesorhizobium sanjuanii TaxID=2037900 RepID=UPI003CC9E741